MPSFRSDTSTSTPLRSLPVTVSPVWLTSAATVPLLAALVAERLLNEGMLQVGLACEEVFRGVRLPLIKAPHGDSTPPSATND
ncbi:MAG: hypothetical protein AAFU71_15320 [Cyanobacteria bacterium J06632_22]